MNIEFKNFYSKQLGNFGATAKGMGWKDDLAQRSRFEQLIKIVNTEGLFSINDLGCGSGDLISLLEERERQTPFIYFGYDIMDEMVRLAELRHGKKDKVTFAHINHPQEMVKQDYTVASGIFNIRFRISNDEWLKYILETIDAMNDKSLKGFSFNMLTKYSDAEFMKEELYYGDPCWFFDYCKTRFSKNVAVLHDYNQYDFTILVRKNS